MRPTSCSFILERHRGWHLAALAFFLLLMGQPARGQERVLTNVLQILELPAQEARSGVAVRITAVVTLYHPISALLFVQDKTGGVYIYNYVVKDGAVLREGQKVEVQGSTGSGRFSPIISPGNIRVLSEDGQADPLPLDPVRLLSGAFDSQYVEMEGVVTQQTNTADRVHLQIANGTKFTVWVLRPNMNQFENLVDCKIKVRGVAGAQFSEDNRPVRFFLYAVDSKSITVLQRPPARDWDIPVIPLSKVLAFSTDKMDLHQVHVTGSLAFQWPGHHLFLQTEEGGILVHCSKENVLNSEEGVEAVGFPSLVNGDYTLENAMARSSGKPERAAIRKIGWQKLLSPLNHFTLIESEASVLELGASRPDLHTFLAGDPQTPFLLCFPAEKGKPAPDLKAGDFIRFQGVAQNSYDALNQQSRVVVWSDGAKMPALILRTRPLPLGQLPPQWLKLTTLLLAGSVILLLCSLVIIRRRSIKKGAVLQQAQILSQELLSSNESQIRQFIEDREKMSRDLHDEIIQSIYGIGLGLEECKSKLNTAPNTVKENLERAQQGLNGVIRNVRKFIANIEERTLKGREFKTAVKSLLLTLGDTTANQISLDIDEDTAEELQPGAALQMLNITKEAIVNSLRHSGAKSIKVYLHEEEGNAVLGIQDDGKGFNVDENSPNGFGLRNMRSRAKEMGATFEIESRSGKGTHIRVELPGKIL